MESHRKEKPIRKRHLTAAAMVTVLAQLGVGWKGDENTKAELTRLRDSIGAMQGSLSGVQTRQALLSAKVDELKDLSGKLDDVQNQVERVHADLSEMRGYLKAKYRHFSILEEPGLPVATNERTDR